MASLCIFSCLKHNWNLYPYAVKAGCSPPVYSFKFNFEVRLPYKNNHFPRDSPGCLVKAKVHKQAKWLSDEDLRTNFTPPEVRQPRFTRCCLHPTARCSLWSSTCLAYDTYFFHVHSPKQMRVLRRAAICMDLASFLFPVQPTSSIETLTCYHVWTDIFYGSNLNEAALHERGWESGEKLSAIWRSREANT